MNQQQEIETIKDRTITLKLSDADCERISVRAGMYGLTVPQLLENFIGDLIGGTYSNGSDERDRADDWFERCWFSFMYDKTLLRHLLEWNNDIDDFLSVCDEIIYFEENPEDYVDELASGQELWFFDEFRNYTEEFLESNPDADMKKEIEICRKWYNDLQSLKDIGGGQ